MATMVPTPMAAMVPAPVAAAMVPAPVMPVPVMTPAYLDWLEATDLVLRNHSRFRNPAKCGLYRRHRGGFRGGRKCQCRSTGNQCNPEIQEVSALHDFLLH